ncbi:MAG TPA: long-chain fatty acid--CoA ligase [Bacteroidales bacterium]|nr:long-chain fatty acid--CoA ligase [Bacteroidales bacterium]
MNDEIKITRLFDLLERLQENYPKEDILAGKVNGSWKKYSSKEYSEISHYYSYGFLELGLKPGDKVITVMNNRPEWNFTDMGTALSGLVHVPVYTTLSEDDYLYIIPHSDAKVIIIGTASLHKHLAPVIAKLDNPPMVFTIDEVENVRNLNEIRLAGEKNKEKWEPVIEKNKKTITPDTLLTIIYTSGTTGTPKGVMHAHSSIVFNFLGHAAQQVMNASHRYLSFLPLCHIYERTMNYEFQSLGISIYYAESMGTIARDLKDIQADGFCAVPRVVEMMYKKLEDAGKSLTGIKRIIYRWAWNFGNTFDYENLTFWRVTLNKLFDKLVYSKWRANLGGHEMLIVTGGSSIRACIIRLFSAAKMYIYEGYGMTETAPVIAVNNPKGKIRKIGTVGKVMEGTEVKFAPDGEILTRGPHIMMGYYKNPQATKEAIDSEGWFHTGDVGKMVDGLFLRITDRKKEIFKLSNGKYVAPQLVENKLNESPYIESSLVIGSNQKVASAIIIPNAVLIQDWAAHHQMVFQDLDNLYKTKEVNELIRKEIERINKTLAPHEQIKFLRLVDDEWNTANGLLSQTLKLRRAQLNKYYEKIIADIYSDSKGK